MVKFDRICPEVEVLDEIRLDPGRDKIYGWEMRKGASKVADYVKKNLEGSIAPAIEVVRNGDIYELVVGKNRKSNRGDYNPGGHHRFISGIISGSELDCHVISEHRSNYVDRDKFRSIENIVLCRYNNSVAERLVDFPDDVFLRFVEKLDIVSVLDWYDFSSENKALSFAERKLLRVFDEVHSGTLDLFERRDLRKEI